MPFMVLPHFLITLRVNRVVFIFFCVYNRLEKGVGCFLWIFVVSAISLISLPLL